jgi:FliI/YscN family ATPase
MDLDHVRRRLSEAPTTQAEGRVRAVSGAAVTVALPGARVRDLVRIRRRGEPLLGEVVGFAGGEAVALPLGSLEGVGPDDPVEHTGGPLTVAVGSGLLGRVLDGLGAPIDGGAELALEAARPALGRPPAALGRRRVTEPLVTGVRVLDGLLTLGVGQRVGLFSGSGVGKSTLLGSLAVGSEADVVVVALVGERGREVGDLIERVLAPVRERSVVVVTTSDAPAVERLRAAEVATTVAEHFRDAGKRVLLLVDSITRVARAQRDVGLAAGEIPARRGFPPSVFAMLPGLLERAGQGPTGSITAVYTVLVEGDDLDEPVADEVRGLLDGHVVLGRALAERGIFPAIDVPASVSRVMDGVVTSEHAEAAARVRAALGLLEQKRDLVTLGAYREGSDVRLDRALACSARIEDFVRQTSAVHGDFESTVEAVRALAASLA